MSSSKSKPHLYAFKTYLKTLFQITFMEETISREDFVEETVRCCVQWEEKTR